MSEAVTGPLAELAATCRWPSLPDSAQHAVRRTLLNAVALAVGASRHEAVEHALRTYAKLEPAPAASVLGRPEMLGVTTAPLVNGIAVHVEDFDDTHLPTVVHPGACVVPAVLAAAEHAGADEAATLAGLAAGVEVALRVANGMCPEHFDRGWHVTGTAGHIGAAAGAARVLGLDVAQTVVAVGLGATQASGLTAALGTMTKPFHPGKAAADGVEAALLASAGFSGPAAPIEGRRGFATIASPRADGDVMLRGLGERWELEANAFKPYACGIVSHAAIDAAIDARGELGGEEIAEVVVTVNPVVLDVMGIRDPADGLETKFSVYHCVAVGLVDGAGGTAQFADALARSGEIVAVRDRVRIIVDAEVAKGAARLWARTAGGRELRTEIRHATGSAERPMTDEQLRHKAEGLVAPVLGDDGAGALVAACTGAGDGPDVRRLVAAARPATARAGAQDPRGD